MRNGSDVKFLELKIVTSWGEGVDSITWVLVLESQSKGSGVPFHWSYWWIDKGWDFPCLLSLL